MGPLYIKETLSRGNGGKALLRDCSPLYWNEIAACAFPWNTTPKLLLSMITATIIDAFSYSHLTQWHKISNTIYTQLRFYEQSTYTYQRRKGTCPSYEMSRNKIFNFCGVFNDDLHIYRERLNCIKWQEFCLNSTCTESGETLRDTHISFRGMV